MMKALHSYERPAAMQPNITTIDLRSHPLDPARVGSEGLVELLVGKFEAAVNDPALVRSYAEMTETLLDVRYRQAVRA